MSKRILITDTDLLKERIRNIDPIDAHLTNGAYGMGFLLKRYAEISESVFLNFTMEHGVDIGYNYLSQLEMSHENSIVLVASDERKKLVEKYTYKKAITIGPLIAYAENYYDRDQYNAMKKKLGKTLLIIPYHGMEKSVIKYDIDAFIKKIEDIKDMFDTVMVCLYYADIDSEFHRKYQEKGYLVVSSGYMFDKWFLDRQKTIIELSDAVMSNSYTNGVPNALYLRKPVYVFPQEVKLEARFTFTGFVKHDEESEKDFLSMMDDETFGRLDQQIEWGKYYFGLDKKKTKEEVREIINYCKYRRKY